MKANHTTTPHGGLNAPHVILNAPHVILNAVKGKDLMGYRSNYRSFAPLRMTSVFILLFLLASCQQEEERARPLPATIAHITIAGTTAQSRTAASPEKTAFAEGDIIDLAYYNGSVALTMTATVDAAGQPVPEGDLYVNTPEAGNNTITATYTPADPADAFLDHLEATAQPVYNYSAGTATISLAFDHLRGMIALGTVRDANGNALTVDPDRPATAEVETPTGTDARTLTLPAIVPDGYVVTALHLTLTSGQTHTARPATDDQSHTVHRGKKLSLNITVGPRQATIDPTAAGDITPWGGEATVKPVPEGYDRAIYDEADLVAFRDAIANGNALNAKVIQMADITLTGEWTLPIAYSYGFAGTYDGGGYTISGLKVNRPGDYAALFGTTNGATLTGINLRDVEVEGAYAASLVVNANSTAISLCSATGSATGSNGAGGLVETLNPGSTLVRSRATCTVIANNNYTYAGGLVAFNSGSTILGCMAGGSVTGETTFKGALVGYNANGAIYHSYTTIGDIGLIGFSEGDAATIASSYGPTQAFDAAGNTIDATSPGDHIRQGNHEAGGITYLGSKIWTTGQRPTLHYTYAGETPQQP